jgi:hypothetical protein
MGALPFAAPRLFDAQQLRSQIFVLPTFFRVNAF